MNDFNSSQSAWMEEELIINRPTEPIEVLLEANAFLQDINSTAGSEDKEEEGEEFGEFISASTDPLQQPVHAATDENDETLPLLNTESNPKLEDGMFTGFGLVQPVFARLDNRTRHVRQAGKSFKRTWLNFQDFRLSRVQTLGESPASTAARSSMTIEELADLVGETVRDADSLRSRQAARSVYAAGSLFGVMQPVSFVPRSLPASRYEGAQEVADTLEAKRAARDDDTV